MTAQHRYTSQAENTNTLGALRTEQRLLASGLTWRGKPRSLVLNSEMKAALCYPTILVSGLTPVVNA